MLPRIRGQLVEDNRDPVRQAPLSECPPRSTDGSQGPAHLPDARARTRLRTTGPPPSHGLEAGSCEDEAPRSAPGSTRMERATWRLAPTSFSLVGSSPRLWDIDSGAVRLVRRTSCPCMASQMRSPSTDPKASRIRDGGASQYARTDSIPYLRSRSTFRTPTFGRSSISRSKSTSGSASGRVQSMAPPRSPAGPLPHSAATFRRHLREPGRGGDARGESQRRRERGVHRFLQSAHQRGGIVRRRELDRHFVDRVHLTDRDDFLDASNQRLVKTDVFDWALCEDTKRRVKTLRFTGTHPGLAPSRLGLARYACE